MSNRQEKIRIKTFVETHARNHLLQELFIKKGEPLDKRPEISKLNNSLCGLHIGISNTM